MTGAAPRAPEVLAAVVEAQAREIAALRARLGALTPAAPAPTPSLSPPTPSSPPPPAAGGGGIGGGVGGGVGGGGGGGGGGGVGGGGSVGDGVGGEGGGGVGGRSEEVLRAALPALVKGLCGVREVEEVRGLAARVCGDRSEEVVQAFYRRVVEFADARGAAVARRDAALDPRWFHDPWYCCYVQYTGTPGSAREGGFEDLVAMVPYFVHAGYRNIYLLPHYESPMGDGGYDVSGYEPRAAMGGEPGFDDFMRAATEAGLRVATDAVFNHTSTEHPWFQAALAGNEEKLAYYVQRNGREKIAEYDREGDIVCRYRDPDGTVTERVCVFPDVDRTHGLWAEVNGKTYQFYREFYPFQVDLNLQNPAVLDELFCVLGRELNAGVLGKRMDAIAHWIKAPGSTGEGLPESHAVQALLKSFMRHICSRAIVIPEVVRSLETVADYAGGATQVNGVEGPSEGDALLSFEMQAALREVTYFQTVAPFWQRVFRTPRLPAGAVWVNLLEHHDETYVGFFAPEVRQWIREYITSRGGVVYKNGMSAGGRYADCLDRDARRIATAIFLLYMSPGVPMMYAGLEIGWRQNHDHALAASAASHKRWKRLGVHVPESACYDPRELQRGPIPRAAFDDARKAKYLPLETARKLNELRRLRRSLCVCAVHPVDSGDIGVLCLVREEAPPPAGDTPLLCVANLTPFDKDIVMPVWQVRQRLRVASEDERAVLHMSDLLTGARVTAARDHTSFRFSLKAFDRYILELERVAVDS